MTSTRRRHGRIASAVALLIPLLLPGGSPGRDRSAERVPEAGGDGVARIRANLLEREYQASHNDRGLQAPNRAHRLRTYFEPTGIRVLDRTAEGDATLLDLRLAGVGRGPRTRTLGAGTVTSSGARVEIRRDGLVEWYENSPAGLEQGFTLESPPAGAGPLTLELAVGRASATPAGDGVGIHTRAGRRLDYRKLAAFDARGAALAARMEVPAPDRIRIRVDDAGAEYPVTIDPLLTASADAVIESDRSGANLGWSVAGAGDVNGDGYSDVIVGAVNYDGGSVSEGAAFVFHGGPGGIAGGNPATAATVIESNQVAGLMGRSVAGAGDVNGDGYGDVIVGVEQYDSGSTNEGAALVFHGGPGGIPSGDPGTAAATIETNQDYALLGRSVAGAGDVNGDGYGDVIVGAWQYDGGATDAGGAFLFLGGPDGIASGDPTTADAVITGDQANAFLGWSVGRAGDVNGDGYGDVLIGARQYDAGSINEGMALLFLGGPDGITGGGPAQADARIEANQMHAQLGSSVAAAGDVNGDGYGDIVIGAFAYDAGSTDEGAAFVFLGHPDGIASGSPASAATRLESNQPDAQLGYSVAGAGDVNGDGYADVIVGLYLWDGGDMDEGAAMVFLGGPGGIPNGSPATAAAAVESNQAGFVYLGTSVAGAGDVNGDGYADVIAGAPYFDAGSNDEGAAFVYLGGAGGIVTGGPSSAAATLQSSQDGAWLGASVAGAGDVNGDGFADVIVGAPFYDAGSTDEGAAFVFHGGPNGIASGDPASAAARLESNQAGAQLGQCVAGAGDVNGDGYADVIVGAHLFDADSTDEGAAFVFLGGPGGIACGDPSSAAARLESNQAGAFMGQSVASAGDVDGDGYADVIVGAHFYDTDWIDAGAAFVFRGGPGGIAGTDPTSAATVLESDQADARFGASVAGAGDVDGDGYDDVIVGAYLYDRSEQDEGVAFVYRGGAGGITSGDPTTAAATFESNQAGAAMGYGVAGAGDVGGDGRADVLVAAHRYDAGQTDEGAVFVFEGGAGGMAGGDPLSAAATLQSDQAGALLGYAVAGAGDVNGDGHADVIVGAVDHDGAVDGEGAAFVFMGGPEGIASGSPTTAAAVLVSGQEAAHLGRSVAGAGDVNGDGYADVVVGSYAYDAGSSDEGAAFVFMGGGLVNGARTLAGGGTRGRRVLARQHRGDGSGRPVQAWGGSHLPGGFGRLVTATDPRGRGRVRVETESCAPGVPFGHPSCVRTFSPAWVDVTADSAGVDFDDSVTGLAANTLQRWRARVLHAPFGVTRPGITAPAHPPHGPWRRLAGQAVEADVRIGGGLLAAGPGADPGSIMALELFPNPSRGEITVSFALGRPGAAKLEVFDVVGRRVLDRDLGPLAPGRHATRWVADRRLGPGIYLVRLSHSEPRATIESKVLLMR